MNDGRSNRKSKVVAFLTRVERERKKNLAELISKAKMMRLDGFESIDWDAPRWVITSGRLIKLTGRNSISASLNFTLPPKLEANELTDDWGNVAKSLLILRFHRYNQAVSNQRNFITAVGYVSYAAQELGQRLDSLTPEALDSACQLVTQHYKEGTAYNLHKHIAEFASHCDANGLCRVKFHYKYSKLKRPENTGGVGIKRLDDPTVIDTKSDKLIEQKTFKVIGELYQKLPSDHKYRVYILILTLLACTGRRFSEITELPNQVLQSDDTGNSYLYYFPRKASHGDVYTPKRRLYLPSEVVPIVNEVIEELRQLTESARSSAEEMHRVNGPDLRFISDISYEDKLYKDDLRRLGLSNGLLSKGGWLRQKQLAWPDPQALTRQGLKPANPIYYTNKAGLEAYCGRDFNQKALEPFHIDEAGKEYKLKDLLILRHLSLSSGYTFAHWVATHCTHSMFTTFLRYFADLAKEFTSSSAEVDFTSHHFRHTINTLLDEGGLSDLLQTEWFGRSNARDTKAYQHTSREKRALMLREDIKKGLVGGQLAQEIRVIPINARDAVLKARVQAVHDVGTGICIHNFSQTPCERHLQCSADCKDYVWAKDDKGRLEEQKRQYALTLLAMQSAESQRGTKKPKRSADWLLHNEKKLNTLAKQLADNGVDNFDAEQYLKEISHG